jgi:hypothetical protein
VPPAPITTIENVKGVKVVETLQFGGDTRVVAGRTTNANAGSIGIRQGSSSPSAQGMRFRAPDGLCPTGSTTTTAAAPVVRRRN